MSEEDLTTVAGIGAALLATTAREMTKHEADEAFDGYHADEMFTAGYGVALREFAARLPVLASPPVKPGEVFDVRDDDDVPECFFVVAVTPTHALCIDVYDGGTTAHLTHEHLGKSAKNIRSGVTFCREQAAKAVKRADAAVMREGCNKALSEAGRGGMWDALAHVAVTLTQKWPQR